MWRYGRNGLRGEIKQANTYYDDPHHSFGAFDYVLANPPFNVDEVSFKSVEKDRRFNTHGLPGNKGKLKKGEEGKETVPNANYLWINLFATSLKPQGRAALVMANSASDARHSEADIRRRLIEQNLIAGMLTLPSNMFYTVTLPATLWFFDRAKPDDRILFIDARNVFTQVDRAHREFSDEQIANLALISHLRHGHRDRFVRLIDRYFALGMTRLRENQAQVAPVSAQLLDVLAANGGRESPCLGSFSSALPTTTTAATSPRSSPSSRNSRARVARSRSRTSQSRNAGSTRRTSGRSSRGGCPRRSRDRLRVF